jgi:hypothetical protein
MSKIKKAKKLAENFSSCNEDLKMGRNEKQNTVLWGNRESNLHPNYMSVLRSQSIIGIPQ